MHYGVKYWRQSRGRDIDRIAPKSNPLIPGPQLCKKSHQNPLITLWDFAHTQTDTHKIRTGHYLLSGGNNLKLLITYRSSCMTVSMIGLPRVSGSTKHSRALDSASTANTRDGKANQYFRCQVYTYMYNTCTSYMEHNDHILTNFGDGSPASGSTVLAGCGWVTAGRYVRPGTSCFSLRKLKNCTAEHTNFGR